MPVEKMEMISAVGSIDDIDKISDQMVKCGCIHVVNALEDIEQSLRIAEVEEPLDVKPYKDSGSFYKARDQIYEIIEILGIDKVPKKRYIEETCSMSEVSQKIASIHKEASRYKRMLYKSEKELGRAIELDNSIKNIKELRFAISELRNLKFFSFKAGRFSRDYYAKLKENIENIPSIIYKVSSDKGGVTVVTFTPYHKEHEAAEIFKSLGFEEIFIPDRVKGIPEEVIRKLEELIHEREEKIRRIKEDIHSLKQKHGEFMERCFTLLRKYEKGMEINNEAARTNHAFIISGWIPENVKQDFMKRIESIQEKMVVVYRNEEDAKRARMPTKLRNNRFAKPFEYIVNMYGIPGYSEIDPTFFVAVTYTIMFGAMFGDVGQGGILLLAGLYLTLIKKSYEFGGILSRIGTSSVIFGFLYGSVFGNEEIIKPLLFHPLENVNTVLLAGVLFGIVLSTIGYIANFINCARNHELEEGLFSENGMAGFTLYWGALIGAYILYQINRVPVPLPLAIVFFAVLLGAIVLKQPLSRLIEGKRPLHKDKISDYYVESIFGAVETVMTMLSKTVSFVRIGAFAINHVGLFIAFSTLAELVRSKTGGLLILILGNIIIIGLEGLIVLIQCLRLEFYEVFSRFYKGNGFQYSPVDLLYEDEINDGSNES